MARINKLINQATGNTNGFDVFSDYKDTTPTEDSTNVITSGAVKAALDEKQDALVSGTNIKTVNGQSILGEGNITIEGGSGSVDIVDNLTTADATKALSAKQGKVLSEQIAAISSSSAAFSNVYDVTKATSANYATLTAALAAVPSDYQVGGLTLKFYNSSEAAYETYYLTSNTWSVNVWEWKKISDSRLIDDDVVYTYGDYLGADSTEYVERLNGYGYYANKTIITNSYTDNYYYTLYLLSANTEYHFICNRNNTQKEMLVAVFSSVDDFVVGGVADYVLLSSSHAVGDIVKFKPTTDTYVAVLGSLATIDVYVRTRKVASSVSTAEQTTENRDDIAEMAASIADEYTPTLDFAYGYIKPTTGVLVTHSTDNNYRRTGYIALETGASTLRYTSVLSNSWIAAWAFYDENHTLLSIDDNSVNGVISGSVSIPSNAVYFVVSAKSTDVTATNVSVTIGKSVVKSVHNLDERVTALENGGDKIVVIPDNLYAVVGHEFNLYYDNIVKGLDNGLNSPLGYYVEVLCPTLQTAANRIGVRRERMWQITADALTADYVGTHEMTINVFYSTGELVETKTVTMNVLAATGLAEAKNVLCIGDSLTNGGAIVATAAEDFIALGGTTPTFIGSRTSYGYHHEGYPGKTFAGFCQASSNYVYIFQVPIATNIAVGDVYTTSNNNYTVSDLRTETETTMSVRCSLTSGSATPSVTGTLTFVSGSSDSDATIEYSDYERQNGNPFWNDSTSEVDFTNYLTDYGCAGELDAAVIMLGVNDSIAFAERDMTSSITAAETLINAILADSPNCKIVLQLPTIDANTISSWQVYSDGSGSRKMMYHNNLWSLRQLLYNTFKDNTSVIIGQAAYGLDRYYGYPYTSVQSSNRISSVTEVYHTNSVHPNSGGYQQLGDGYFLTLMAALS